MRLGAVLGFAAGLGLAAWLLASYGIGRVFDLIGHAGWLGLSAVILFHLIQLAFSAAAWRRVAGPTEPRPSLFAYARLRWIREGVNNLLPVAQIGGEFVAAALLRRAGLRLVNAIAGAVCDLTMEMVTQIAFTLLGLGVLLAVLDASPTHAPDLHTTVAHAVIGGLIVAMLAAAGFLAAQWFGLAVLIERGLMRLGGMIGWGGFGEVEGLHATIRRLYSAPANLAMAGLWHSISWLLGALEVCLAMHVLGHGVSLSVGLVIESLGQALKAVGFAVPGALGVQEGGYIVICGLFSLSPELAIALSLVKRLREVVLGVPALVAWQVLRAAPAHLPGPPAEAEPQREAAE